VLLQKQRHLRSLPQPCRACDLGDSYCDIGDSYMDIKDI